MSNPYREYNPLQEEKAPKNVYRYILREDDFCPICRNEIASQIYSHFRECWINNRRHQFCHPLKRIYVAGMWWWKKQCPVEGVHFHLRCRDCKVAWIRMKPDQSEATLNIKEAYL